MTTNVSAVTFDYWRTLVWEPPGELEKHRLRHWTRLLADRRNPPTPAELQAAHAAAFTSASASWRANVQFRADEAADMMIAHLELALTQAERAELVTAFSLAGAETSLQLAPGIAQALDDLKGRGVRLGIVCDVGLTPSPVLRDHLERFGLLDKFDHWSFSDEVHCYKPSAKPFQHACAGLGTRPEETAHVGDQRRTDVQGALDAGLVAVRYSGIFDDPDDSLPSGDLVLESHLDLNAALGEKHELGPRWQ